MTTLAIAAQKHHNETNPLTVSHINSGVTMKFTPPNAGSWIAPRGRPRPGAGPEHRQRREWNLLRRLDVAERVDADGNDERSGHRVDLGSEAHDFPLARADGGRCQGTHPGVSISP